MARSVRGEPEGVLLDRFGVKPEARWDWARIEQPHAGRRFAGPNDFQDWLLAHLRKDIAEAWLMVEHRSIAGD